MCNSTTAPQWLNHAAAAHRLGVDRFKLRELRDSAGLPHHRAGSCSFLYEAATLDAWKAAHDATDRPRRLSRYGSAGR